MNVGWRCCAAIALGVLCGCETMTVPPEPPGAQRYDLESASSRLMSEMLSSAAFKRHHAAIEKAKGSHAVIVVGEIENCLHNTHPDCEIVRNRVQVLLNEPGLFDVYMGGFERAFDYQVIGFVKSDYDAANPKREVNPRLHLKIIDANSGKIIWSGTQYNLQL